MIESGVNIVAVSKILGHASIKTTMRYLHPEDSLKDAVECLSFYSEKSSAKAI
jgi:site-specific recombinase XerD